MEKRLQQLQHWYQDQFVEAAVGHLMVGLSLFHEYEARLDSWQREAYTDVLGKWKKPTPQVALGNLVVSAELMLKGMVAGKELASLFTNLPPDLKRLGAVSDSLPECELEARLEKLRRYLESVDKNSVTFDACRGLVDRLYPDFTDTHKAYLRALRLLRNRSCHDVLPELESHEVHRAAYAALLTEEFLNRVLNRERGLPGLPDFLNMTGFTRTDNDTQFVQTYEERKKVKLERLKTVLAAAKSKAEQAKKKSAEDATTVPAADRQHLAINCPVCMGGAIMTGTTEVETSYDVDEDGIPDVCDTRLVFSASRFRCTQCGLALDDPDELEVAGFPLRLDRFEDVEPYAEGEK